MIFTKLNNKVAVFYDGSVERFTKIIFPGFLKKKFVCRRWVPSKYYVPVKVKLGCASVYKPRL